ncbi:sigma-70 family RNA polymerase sigma factor [uncultured Polaribacter sp.]|uniref:RNA polymerase sigma factor n=1 Tax=uncultured Polaribacter sp. TaxID=174711 RepID=UPI002633E8D5|nr:sigma-70 family RNA polymerase sigma factor [uncultured Polaribacter sp.]
MKIDNKNIELYILEAKTGSQSAFRFLLNTFWADVYNFQLKRTKSENDAEDITIQTFSKAFDKIHSFDENYIFKTWLITISKNVHIDILRKKKISITTETTNEQESKVYLVVDDNPTPEDKIIRQQNLEKLLRDIKKLKPKYKEIIHLRYFQELSYKEISEHINEPMNNVKVKLLRAKKLLAEIIKES